MTALAASAGRLRRSGRYLFSIQKKGRLLKCLLGCIGLYLLSRRPSHVMVLRDYSTNRNACSKLGIPQLHRIEAWDETYTNRSLDGLTWRLGHFPYSVCPFDTTDEDIISTSERKFAVLTVLDKNYLDVLPSWVQSTLKAKVSCFVLSLDDVTCAHVQSFGCSCIQLSKSYSEVSPAQKGWHPKRVAAVKFRFLAAAELLERGYDILMHDADAIVSPKSITKMLQYVALVKKRKPDIRLMVQDGGKRKVNFDQVNWGFAWLKSSNQNIDILHCSLQKWNDPAFGCADERKCDTSYHYRSQPRVNHILERTIQSGFDLGICLIGHNVLHFLGVNHMSGYTNALMKKTCAKGRGALSELTDIERTIVYEVPADALPHEQRTALQGALALAAELNRKVQIPSSFYRGERVDVCLLFDLQHPKLHGLLVTRLSTGCGGETLPITSLQDVHSSKNQHLCVEYKALTQVRSTSADHSRIPLCNPRNEKYAGLHMCQRPDMTDEKPY